MKRLVIVLAALVLAGCAFHSKPVKDRTPDIAADLSAARKHVVAADAHLAQTPPKVPEARQELKATLPALDSAANSNAEQGKDNAKAEAERQKLEATIKDLNDSFWSPRQKHLVFWFIVGTVLLGILAAVGNFVPGWWSLPALWAIKAVRFVIFGGVPHLVYGAVWLWANLLAPAAKWTLSKIVGLFRLP